ncbi:MAG: thioredoxin [Patescibacteria group bacterium]|nr:thioredoxin [Patescibacteria group bacterium]
MGKATDLLKSNFEAEVLKSEVPVLVDFWAPWCMPCRMMAPILDELAGELEGKVKITKIDTENPENQELAVKYQIQSIPNMKLFKGGEVIDEFIGMRSKDALKEELEKHL